jgi:malonate decarboxylase epsilon subunit
VSICFLFPGQGSQSPGMLKRLPEHPAVESTFRQAGEILQCDISALDSEDSLQSTVSVQLALFIAGVAAARALQAEQVIPEAVAGLSVGAFAAAVICDSLPFADGLKIVKQRAQLMESKFPSGYGMGAIVGLSEQKVTELVERVYEQSAPVFVSNINAPRQITIAGSLVSIEKVAAAALKSGARKAERLNVAVPSHCPLFQDVAEKLQEALGKVKMQDPAIPYVSNVRARPLRTGAKIAEDLANNIAHGVRWYDSMCVLEELGTDMFVEMNPGNVLSRMGTESFQGSFQESFQEFFRHLRFIALEDSSLAYVSGLAHARKDVAP